MSSNETKTNFNHSSNHSDNDFSSEIVRLQKMLFVFNALLSGWTVKMVGNDTFEFKKDRKNQEVNLDNYLKTFVIQNLNVDNISNICNDTRKNNGNVPK